MTQHEQAATIVRPCIMLYCTILAYSMLHYITVDSIILYDAKQTAIARPCWRSCHNDTHDTRNNHETHNNQDNHNSPNHHKHDPNPNPNHNHHNTAVRGMCASKWELSGRTAGHLLWEPRLVSKVTRSREERASEQNKNNKIIIILPGHAGGQAEEVGGGARDRARADEQSMAPLRP